MVALWLFFAAWFLGVTFWKAPQYARLYDGLDMHNLPTVTRAILDVSSHFSRLWFVVLPLMLVPLAFIALGTLDGKTGPFTVVMIVALFLVVSFSSLFLFLPADKIQQRLRQIQEAPLNPRHP